MTGPLAAACFMLLCLGLGVVLYIAGPDDWGIEVVLIPLVAGILFVLMVIAQRLQRLL